ncbi:MAG: hypothetical protein QOH89_2139, partial [Pseudonocardiales bacterium]|nr:hypothetical protein [Pseudonocardiales bacterium]MDT5222060.1 hypothetical protein [Mycobacterium sp.]
MPKSRSLVEELLAGRRLAAATRGADQGYYLFLARAVE